MAAAEPWLQPKKKVKKRKQSPSSTPPKKKKKKRNYSIKPPPTSSKKGKTKTGFNSKSLQFEPGMCVDQLNTLEPNQPRKLREKRVNIEKRGVTGILKFNFFHQD